MEQQKVRKYILYAIGEIILVVIGILIALQVNNWNEERIRQSDIQDYVISMISDLEKDRYEIDIRIQQIEARISMVDDMADYVRSKSLNEIRNEDLLLLSRTTYFYRPYTWYRSSIDEITSSGTMKDIVDVELREKIVSYYALSNHLEGDYVRDEENAAMIEEMFDQIINHNYPIANGFKDSLYSLREVPIEEWPESNFYRRAQEMNYGLLIHDRSILDKLVNISFRYQWELRTRSGEELPRLKNLGEEIITMIQDRYGE